ncbi:hypothetical protein SSX86_018097 [Deinandra increscens subsp. villosa]|uniref:DUF4378 domain-containing protein n=1 Tax=Deinandra increscens subsp. villosa TaxID=3103831 RepID=A0AAP0CVE8_9ASTR
MGKQWSLYGAASSATSSSTTSTKKTAGKSRKKGGGGGGDRSHMPSSSSSSSSTFGGCMSAFFHLFDIQHHHLPFHQPSFISESSIKIPQEPNIILKGAEAPRNSLELEEQESVMVTEEAASSSSSSSKLKQETNFNLPAMREIQIKTKRSRLMEDISSECSSSSPSTKTPSLVARLMGLDLLPESSSPRASLSSPRVSSSSSSKCTTRSLPVTPRISSATLPRRSTEVNVYHHRLSLQTNQENKRRYDENTSEYAKQIAKQVRENISRRVAGADITNSVKKNEHRRDEYLVVLKPKRPSPPPSATSAVRRGKENIEPVPLSCSPRLRLLDITNNINYKPNYSTVSEQPIKAPALSTVNYSSPLVVKDEVQVVKPMKVQKCKKLASEKYDLRLKKQEEPVVMKKCSSNMKSTPLSKHLVKKVNTTTKFISSKKDMASNSSSTTVVLPQKQVPLASITQLPSCQSRSYNTNNSNGVRTNGNGAVAGVTTTGRSVSVSVSVSDYFEYISRILSHSGIEKNTLISISHWYSPSHPLHPSIFQQIEKNEKHLLHPDNAAANRKLIFDVADELLVEILKPYISLKPWASGHRNSHRMYGSELVIKLCEKIGGFPGADCQVLEDIDGLIEGDMRRSTRAVGARAFEEEAEELVREMEREMVDTLVGEVAAAGIIDPAARWMRKQQQQQQRSLSEVTWGVMSRDQMPFGKGCT